ncbi:Trypsin-like peptidase domain-containing protein [Cupriavidus sp. YR651]|uniref:trypsin-like peptidase domain-containing protein n=1 Tax=Cupriavidus sp. YR651 TaxID=1855315 RepID=UPI0008897496|nr:trypsin-like peptidase domain-containing protein [Cupriavidus sp. YR651]SDC88726.1 Trypsin-like peptidase domain-containing protein [Cupriavidus sp. YR651]
MKRVTIYGWASVAVALVFAAGVASAWLLRPTPRPLTQRDIDAAVMHTLQTRNLPSRTARAAEAIRESVVEIRSFTPVEKTAEPAPSPKNRRDPSATPPKSPPPARAFPRDEFGTADPPGGKEPPAARDPPGGKPEARHIGSGVVVTENGIVITNYHVIADARRLEIRFHDGSTSEASVLQAIPEKDLAIIQAKSIPDDLPAATLGSSKDLAPGTEVVAVGFPFGIGPSVSAGVVSGLDREYISPDKKQNLDKLIQFDAAVNPGNSGGPLVNMNGEVVGIVTAILNPNKSGTFVGIGFAITIESAGSSVGSSPF